MIHHEYSSLTTIDECPSLHAAAQALQQSLALLALRQDVGLELKSPCPACCSINCLLLHAGLWRMGC